MQTIYDKVRASLKRQFSLCRLVSEEDFQKQVISFLMFISENEYLRGYVKNLVSNSIPHEKKLQKLEKETKDILKPVINNILQDIEHLPDRDRKIKEFAYEIGSPLWLKEFEDCKKIKASLDNYLSLIEPLISKVLEKEPADYISSEMDARIRKCCEIRGKYNTLYSVSAREAFVILSGFTVGHLDLETFELPEDVEISRKIKTERNIGELISATAGVMGTQEKAKNYVELIRKKRPSVSIALKRLYYYLLDQIDSQLLNYQILMRYKTRCEWYSRARLQGVIEAAIKQWKKTLQINKNDKKKHMRIEYLLWPDMAEFLFAEGLYPTKMSMGNQIPDFVSLSPPDCLTKIEPLIAECKVLKKKMSEKNQVTRKCDVTSKCKSGMNQTIEAMSRLNQDIGYLVMYNLTEKIIKFPRDLVYNGKKIFIIDIDISDTSPSEKKGKSIIIEPSDLLSKG